MEHAWARLLLFLLVCLPAVSSSSAPAPAAGDAPAARRPGCARRCGGVDVPYPFGLEPQCAIHAGFELNCTSTGGSGGAAGGKLLHGEMEVTKISVQDGKAWLKNGISRQCYNPTTGGLDVDAASMNLTGSAFSISAEENKIVVIGCNSFAYMLSDSYIVGCSSTCDMAPKNGSCAGAGCCQVSLARGIQYYQSFFNPQCNTSQTWRTIPCNYVALVEAASFSFSTAYLTSPAFFDGDNGAKAPVVMDWTITASTCEEAKIDEATPYACVSDNSECVSNETGYRCRCSRGYQGNPYVVGGCTDINECLDNGTYPCVGICKNKVGSFSCSCPRGKHMANGACMPHPKSVWVTPVVGASVGLAVLVIAITSACLIRERRKLHCIKQKYFRQHGGLLLFEEMKSRQGISFKIFSEVELQQATNKFDDQQVLGHGGHGTVYKGVLKSDVEVAVKRCLTIDEQQKKEFGKEMLILSQINHKNIVKLLGCCLEIEVPMLVYEFISNGTLFHLIHGNHGQSLPLAIRLRIAYESAEALAYLHSCASPPILHGDVKSTNILLDSDYTAKVSDFGASILAPNDESQFVTIVQGTCGYLDPEYMQTCQLTDKSDVYSFGVVLLELLTRRKAFNLEAPEHEKSLSLVFMSAMKENKLEDVLDDQLKSNENVEVLEEVAQLAVQCLEMSGVNRPSMKEVAEKLDRLIKDMKKHQWAHGNSPEELESLFGEPSLINSDVVSSASNFSIEKNAIMGLQSGR
ncbi:hypothetical protein ACP4OV_025385 [Aristida adscensionis]